jgi:hypothetical protein
MMILSLLMLIGTVETKQKPVAMDDKTTHGTLSPERTPLQNGING